MKDKFEEAIDQQCYASDPIFNKSIVYGIQKAAEKCNTLHQQALKKERAKLIQLFWEESSKLIDSHRENNDERAAQGVVDCRILIDKSTLKDDG